MTRTMVKLAASVETLVQATTLEPAVLQPVALVGWVTWKARAEAAKARRAATERMAGCGGMEKGRRGRGRRAKEGEGKGTWRTGVEAGVTVAGQGGKAAGCSDMGEPLPAVAQGSRRPGLSSPPFPHSHGWLRIPFIYLE